ncbi:copper homeostasis protein CutC [Pedobacter sp. PWIIR3]
MEVCANSLTSAIEAERGGAVRVELCDNLVEGGTTPSFAQISLAKKILKIQVFPIIRPRGGDFLYTDLEFEIMKADILECKKLGCEGVVFGILTDEGNIDTVRCAELLNLAKPMQATFHRAFDMCKDQYIALEQLISLGFSRILTSGGEDTALKGINQLTALVEKAADRISIMPGAGISLENIATIITQTGVKEFHGSAKSSVAGDMKYRNPKLNMGSGRDEFSTEITNAATVKNLIELANSAE